jgi:hypothetical protein
VILRTGFLCKDNYLLSPRVKEGIIHKKYLRFAGKDVIRINTYDEMLKLLIAYDKKMITQQEFEQRKKELLEEEKRNQTETMASSTILRVQAQADVIREQRSLQYKRYAVLVILMVVLGSAVGVVYTRWQEIQAANPIVDIPKEGDPKVSNLPSFGFEVEKLARVSYEIVEKEYSPMVRIEDLVVKQDAETSYTLSVFRAIREEGRLSYTFYFYEHLLVRIKVVNGGRWLFEGEAQTAQRYGILLTEQAREITINETTRVYQRVTAKIEELAFYLLAEDQGYGAAVFTFNQRVFGALSVENPEPFWVGTQEVVRAALSRPTTAVFAEKESEYHIMEYLGKVWITSSVKYLNAKGEETSSTFVVRFFPDDPVNPNYLEMDGEVLYDWS